MKDTVASISSPQRGLSSRYIGGLQDLPEEAWELVAKPSVGYNYRIEVEVGDGEFTALLDTGASTNAVPEELVIALINHAIERGIRPQDKAWPVSLERWEGLETVTGVARGQDLEIVGAAVIPIGFKGMDGVVVVQDIRFKIFAKGCSGWMGSS